MVEYYNILNAICDNTVDDELCWDEVAVKVDEGEKKGDAFKLLESMGWEFLPDNRCICPYCGKGIKMDKTEKLNLRRIK